MDDYSIKNLIESKNEWCLRLLNIFTPCIIHGFNTILDEAYKLCLENNEYNKYLITFQNFLSRVPKWNNKIIEDEKNRIIEVSNCKYIEDLITCVHILHLKALTCMRVGQKQKKIDLDIPSLDKFVHNVYINSARKLYTNVYLFEKDIPPLEIQRNKREIELIIKECIMNTIQGSVPVEDILSKYLSESLEEDCDITEEVIEKPLDNNDLDVNKSNNDFKVETTQNLETTSVIENTPVVETIPSVEPTQVVETIQTIETTPSVEPIPVVKKTFEKLNFKKPEFNNDNKLNFNNIDQTIDNDGNKENVYFSKDVHNLESKLEGIYGNIDDNDDCDNESDDDKPLVIGDNVKLDICEVNNLNNNKIELQPVSILDDIEVL